MSDYSSKHIRSVYLKRCKEPGFPINLKKPTEARIRKACIDAYQKKNSLIDKLVLSEFLGVSEDKDLIVALRRTTGKFRPVVNFFKNGSQEPRDETIELIVWLIDYRFEDLEEIVEEEDVEHKPGETNPDTNEEEQDKTPFPPTKAPPEPKKILGISNRILRNIIIPLILLIGFISISGVDGIMPYKPNDIRKPKPNEKCMYWNGSYYEPISCDDTISSSKKIIPLQLKELVNLKRNNNPDTLTINDLNKNWYRKLDNNIHLYTGAGRFPLDTSKTLRPLTERIFNQHLANKYSRLDKWLPLLYLVTCVALTTYIVDYFIVFWSRRKRKKQSSEEIS